MRLLICGSRDWTDKGAIIRAVHWLMKMETIDIIIEGENGKRDRTGRVIKGADLLAREVADEMDIPVDPYRPDWSRGLRGGPERNTRMLIEGKPDLVMAFHEHLFGKSKGTKDMVRQAILFGVPVLINPCVGRR